MDVARYLTRIRCTEIHTPDEVTLRTLTHQHVRSIPFENLDIYLDESMGLDVQVLEEKIVGRNRGGMCCELNILFAELLRRLGFEVTLLSVRCWDRHVNGYTQPFDHMALSVTCADRMATKWLVDVGFGSGPKWPLRLEHGATQHDQGAKYLLRRSGDEYVLESHTGDMGRSPLYRFREQPNQADDFMEMYTFHHSSPMSRFTRHWLCVIATATGWRRLVDATVTDAQPPNLRQYVLPNQESVRKELARSFNLVLPATDLRVTESVRETWSENPPPAACASK
jgi:N-hydroxyarylamine O-acetyltransferase